MTDLGGKHILVGAPSTQGTMDDSVALSVFVLFFGGSLHEQQEAVSMCSWFQNKD